MSERSRRREDEGTSGSSANAPSTNAPSTRSPFFGPHDRPDLREHQLRQLRRLVADLLTGNDFYAPRLRRAGLDGAPLDLAAFRARMPFTTKAEITEDQRRRPPYGSNLTYPLERYTRLHQTSGTTGGQPLRWLDTPESWAWTLRAWRRVFEAAGVTAADRVLVAFSFGPFLGFWTAFEAAVELGCLALPGGGLSSPDRLRLMLDNGATVLCCTPTYALRLAEVAAEAGVDLTTSEARKIIVAGEPGGSVPAVRKRISESWGGARVFDHHGLTEVGPVSYPNPDHPDVLHVLESSYLAEVVDPKTGEEAAPGAAGELILTTLGRLGSPLLRYRTGDLVRRSERSPEELGSVDLALEGGILARVDEMVIVRGVNLYPSAVEQVVRGQEGVAEFRVELDTRAALAEVRVLVEPALGTSDAPALRRNLAAALRDRFQMRIPVETVASGTLPRFELKARRWIRRGS